MRKHTSKSPLPRAFGGTRAAACILAVIASLTLILPASQASAQANMLGSETQGPPTPTLTFINGTRDNKLLLKFSSPKASSAAEYRVYRLENYAPEKTLRLVGVVKRDQTNATVATFIDTTVEPSRKYTYFITAKDAFGNESRNSNMMSLQTSAASLFHNNTPPAATR